MSVSNPSASAPFRVATRSTSCGVNPAFASSDDSQCADAPCISP